MQTGTQAERYARDHIAKHMDTSAVTAGFPHETYTSLGPIRTDLSALIASAKCGARPSRGGRKRQGRKSHSLTV